jgi:hypothetical protein
MLRSDDDTLTTLTFQCKKDVARTQACVGHLNQSFRLHVTSSEENGGLIEGTESRGSCVPLQLTAKAGGFQKKEIFSVLGDCEIPTFTSSRNLQQVNIWSQAAPTELSRMLLSRLMLQTGRPYRDSAKKQEGIEERDLSCTTFGGCVRTVQTRYRHSRLQPSPSLPQERGIEGVSSEQVEAMS